MEETLRILVVDDDQVDRMAVRRALKAAGVPIELTEACDYVTAIATLRNSASNSAKGALFDCVFVDYRLPDKDGLELVQTVRGDGSKVPLVVLTGQGDEQIAVELMKAGATDYLPKSKVSPEALAKILRSAVKLYRLELETELAKQQREELARQREDFVHRLTHDLRTPLVAADRMLVLFTQEAFGSISPEMAEAISIMIRSNQNLLQMVNTILEVYRHDAGQKALSFSACDLQQVIREVIQELIPLAEEKGLALTANIAHGQSGENPYSPEPTVVIGDRLELRRVITNLVGNAIKFTDEGSIHIILQGSPRDPSQADAPPPKVTIKVKDTGAGIPAPDQKNLFERFRQGGNKRAGSGLGLYLSRRIVEGHQGTIGVESELGKGSCFTVTLPVQQP